MQYKVVKGFCDFHETPYQDVPEYKTMYLDKAVPNACFGSWDSWNNSKLFDEFFKFREENYSVPVIEILEEADYIGNEPITIHICRECLLKMVDAVSMGDWPKGGNDEVSTVRFARS